MVDPERHYRTLVEAAPLGIFVIDRSGAILEMNKKVLEIVGSPSEETTKGRNVLTYPPLVAAGFSRDVNACFDTGRPVTAERAYHSGWGRETVLRYHLTPLVPDKGPAQQLQAIVEDVTETRRLERQLLHARKMRSLGLLAAGIAHEFNNLLQVIDGYAELLAQDCSATSRRGVTEIREIQTAARRGVDLTNGMLAFGNNLEVNLEPVDLNKEIATSVELLRPTLAKPVAVSLRLGDDLPSVRADAVQIHQALAQLLQNSADALSVGGNIEISTVMVYRVPGEQLLEGDPTAAPYIRLRLRDDGEGILPDDLSSVFDPFFSTRPIGKRRGLGLSVVYGIMTAHGGFVECESTPGEGSVFDLYFPADGGRLDTERHSPPSQQAAD